jgi:hypothetical protein
MSPYLGSLSDGVRDIAGGSAPRPVAGDELIGNIIKVIADDLRLGTYSQNIIANPLDQRGFPTGRHGAKRVPCMTGDKAELGGSNPKLSFDVGVGLT